jgi:HSP20 family molecular chaperone IbpA
MDQSKKRTTAVGLATLVVGLALGLGIGVWAVGNMHASNAANTISSTTRTTPKAEKFTSGDRPDDWDPFRQMERMQDEIDRVIRNATQQFQLGPGATAFRPDGGYSSQFELRDRKDHFELRAYLPDAEASDVNVKIDDDRTLHVNVDHKNKQTKKDGAREARMTELGHYEQVVTLPEAVKSADMKVERNGHEVIITIPKAGTT